MTDYKQLWDRWVALTTLSEDDRKNLLSRLHGEVISGVQALATLATDEMGKILDDAKYPQRDAYLEAIAPVAALGALDGYLFALMERGVNPQTASLATNERTNELGNRWSKAYEKDQNASYFDAGDPIVMLLLEKIQDLRINQALSFHDEIVELPYKVTEHLHQYLGWCVHQGYVFGVMEQELVGHA